MAVFLLGFLFGAAGAFVTLYALVARKAQKEMRRFAASARDLALGERTPLDALRGPGRTR